MSEYAQSYKLLFSHQEMVRDLLLGFVKQPWLENVDLNSLELVSSSYVSDDLRDREDDIIWRVKYKGEWFYIYLLLEFQSTVDPFMALRLLVYLGLLYQELVRTGAVKSGEKLPPVLPIVLYNGEGTWTAHEEIAEMIVDVPGGLEEYRPHLKYLLIDESQYSDDELSPMKNFVAALFRLENNTTPEAVVEVLGEIGEWLSAPEQASLGRAFVVWLNRVWLPSRLPKIEMPPMQDIQEVRIMLKERSRDWTQNWKQEGRQEGRQEGEAAMLTRLLERRFGPLDETVQQRLAAANADTLLIWGDRILTAQGVEDVFVESN